MSNVCMRKLLSIILVSVLVLVSVQTLASIRSTRASQKLTMLKADSTLLQQPALRQDLNGGMRRKMISSQYPVQMQMVGRSIRIQSDYNQILPVYTHSGAFYMIMRLNKGTNWLNGLPRGRFFINNKPIIIN